MATVDKPRMQEDHLPEIRVDPPGLDEVVRELDRDTKHAGRPTLSPRRPSWKTNSFHFPSDARKWMDPHERSALVEACIQVDPGRLGRIPVAAIGQVLAAVGSERLTARAERTLPREKAPSRFGDGEETVSFLSVVDLVAENFRLVRQPFGGKRCIVNRIPLSPCCQNDYCTAHLERPSSARLAGSSEENLKRVALKIVFAKHDADGSGGLDMEELPKILAEFNVEHDDKRLRDMFDIYDVDRSGALDFEEFSALLKDINADKAVAAKSMQAYSLPPALLKEFSAEAIEEMRVTFAMFDESGDGVLDYHELEELLRNFGQQPTKEKIQEEMEQIDYDRSGTIEFQEFVLLMKKVRDGEIELDDSAFGRAIMNSVVASRLNEELRRMEANPIPCVESAKLVKPSPATLHARIACPIGTPYEGRIITLEFVASDGYPFIPPVAKILERVFHLNFSVLLDGTTSMRSLLDQWTAEWDAARLLVEVIKLLREPDPSLLPDNIRRREAVSGGGGSGSGGPTVLVSYEDKDHNNDTASHDDNEWLSSKGATASAFAAGAVATAPPPQKEEVVAAEKTEALAQERGTRKSKDGQRCDRCQRREGRGREGQIWDDDLRIKKWGDLMSARVASLWYDNRALYEQTARRMASIAATAQAVAEKTGARQGGGSQNNSRPPTAS